MQDDRTTLVSPVGRFIILLRGSRDQALVDAAGEEWQRNAVNAGVSNFLVSYTTTQAPEAEKKRGGLLPAVTAASRLENDYSAFLLLTFILVGASMGWKWAFLECSR